MNISNRKSPSTKPYVSLVILTYIKFDLFAELLKSILLQNQEYFEIIIIDSGCLPETKQVIKQYLDDKETSNKCDIKYKYKEACDNPGYAIGNNRGVELVAESSQWILLLNDDIIMEGDKFFDSMLDIAETKESAAAAGCKMIVTSGEKIIEAGSMVFEEASAAGFGRDRYDMDAPELSYPRPVDYISGACLLVNKNVFNDYGDGGFDHKHFPSYYEDTDLQMHIQHDLKMEVWFQPKAVAFHAEHASFGNTDSTELIQKNAKLFKQKWKNSLIAHVPNPHALKPHAMHLAFLTGADLRARDPTKANIIYFDELIPNRSKGRGFGRAFDNIEMLANLGHRITVASYYPRPDKWCDEDCINELTQLGVEVVTTDWQELMKSRVGFYDILLVSRPSTFKMSYKKWREFFKESPMAIIYDCEALWYQRDIDSLNLYKNKGIHFPSLGSEFDIRIREFTNRQLKKNELSLLQFSDIVVPVSQKEANLIQKLLPDVAVQTIGHVMELPDLKELVPFDNREGILFIASFAGVMYYNGDAIWYFLKEIYPLIIADSPIPLTIAGREIPEELREFTKNNDLDRYVTFLESPEDIKPLYDSNRVFIAPHLYGSGIQFKLSECLSMGIATVMSKLSADAFGIKPKDEIACIGDTPESFKKCVISAHNDPNTWTKLRDNGLQFIKETHSREHVRELWRQTISKGQAIYKELELQKIMVESSTFEVDAPCPEGESQYMDMYPHVKIRTAGSDPNFITAFVHWLHIGKAEGNIYSCDNRFSKHGLFKDDLWRPYPEETCSVGEAIYKLLSPDVAKAIAEGLFPPSAYTHWKLYGFEEGKDFYCEEALKILGVETDTVLTKMIEIALKKLE